MRFDSWGYLFVDFRFSFQHLYPLKVGENSDISLQLCSHLFIKSVGQDFLDIFCYMMIDFNLTHFEHKADKLKMQHFWLRHRRAHLGARVVCCLKMRCGTGMLGLDEGCSLLRCVLRKIIMHKSVSAVPWSHFSLASNDSINYAATCNIFVTRDKCSSILCSCWCKSTMMKTRKLNSLWQ